MARTVTFEQPQARGSRRLREDERAVCNSWSKHAAKCSHCRYPVDVWRKGGKLCDRGRMYAIDVAQYIYSKGGRPYSVIDKAAYGQRNEIEMPTEYAAVRELVRAFDKGLTLASKSKPVISQDRDYYVQSRDYAPLEIEITPYSRRERERYHDDNRRKTVHFSDNSYHGSHYHADELARRERRRYEAEPIIILAEPRRTSRYNR
ncbi:uncharacterized protein HMPREF1541_06130 [Cyphellophora europaea CBS 101466]|uniref:Uncharacterized protein n=1 Tax=Cyphellophora europaea (strain CBS 101466) TaxID=1220924 RepID=W2RW50_CYPE1|nr:uncharacterized protein HMPREF1541_06130 [Cyphellophora europaea CBS 101466]ETN39904.1 hypothetical protein HMPREF1541_06130 [Cyphellophora europaea CBS 101466]